ncbi:YggS family pyridoxal phosphate-dependent enzyme [Arenibacter sp. M-2]|uniref:YggS family pyridoxal phosphate-dependent enzyme n=1 Tax=Arenibacter sp. M-2 TaxID=3053612 RepID=UPI00257039F9|nr:YggS family pyridoxal phosphate-dependent enzyme [Arenibacter sp. M-2]MDL5512473.1 YggS family pyridoxal phosphate-dependent enzyme [Arenibacter sp. M-2]
MNPHILNNLNCIRQRIENACIKNHRNPKEIKLLLATKTVTAERIKIALQSGQTLIGENKVQEIKEKYGALKGFPHESHFIGHLQTNKIKELLKYNVSCIQSIDNLRLAKKLHQRLAFEKKEIDVFIQVNTSNEQSKFGVDPDNAIELIKVVSTYKNIHIKGLMTIGLFSTDKDKIRPCFQKLKNLQQEIQALKIPNVEMKELSMGMSSDLEIAIAEGATMVRVGTAIFGERLYPDSYYWNETKN